MGEETFLVGWITALILFSLIEAVTLNLATIWFAIGSIIALIAGLLNFSFPVQLILFIVSSLVLLAFTRPILKDYLKVGKAKTNLDVIIGSTGLVTKEIKPYKYGEVKLNGQLWSAISHDKSYVPENTEVKIISIEGVKLIVKKEEEK